MSFEPYVDNGGTAMAVSGKGFAIICADRRCSKGYNIMSREVTKTVQLTSKCVLASCGMQADRNALHSNLKARMHMYELEHQKEMSTRAIGHLLSRTLYYRRFFPFYTFNLLAGIADDGQGYVYSYDAIGSYEEERSSVTGSGAELATPVLDNVVKKQHDSRKDEKLPLSKDDALKLIKDVMNGVVERDIKTGDSADIYIITPEGVTHEVFPLRID